MPKTNPSFEEKLKNPDQFHAYLNARIREVSYAGPSKTLSELQDCLTQYLEFLYQTTLSS